MTSQPFPPGFVWGTATSSYQIEGAVNEDGRGRSIWDDFTHTPGKIKDGGTGDVAVDHYHRYPEDIALMKSLGVKAYRFSTAWPRILPDGKGRIERRGLDFYSRLVDDLLKAGIEPYLTLYHWDLPSALQAHGGWATRDIAGQFADYAAIVTRALGDRVANWITLNEPWCISFLSHEIGEHAPGLKNRALAMQAAHHCNLAHGQAVQAIRAATPRPADTKVGITLNYSTVLPLTDSAADRRAADLVHQYDPFWSWFTRPLFTGAYGPAWPPLAEGDGPEIRPGDMALICQRLDFLGVNYYTPIRIKDGDGMPRHTRNAGAEYTLMDWEVEPEGLRLLLRDLHQFTGGRVPLFITENGSSFPDAIVGDHQIHDPRRIAYLRGHLDACRRAIAEGVDLRGYFVWSLMDNFEWAHGYQQYFGVVHVDYATQKRSIKDSGNYYRDVVAANAVL